MQEHSRSRLGFLAAVVALAGCSSRSGARISGHEVVVEENGRKVWSQTLPGTGRLALRSSTGQVVALGNDEAGRARVTVYSPTGQQQAQFDVKAEESDKPLVWLTPNGKQCCVVTQNASILGIDLASLKQHPLQGKELEDALLQVPVEQTQLCLRIATVQGVQAPESALKEARTEATGLQLDLAAYAARRGDRQKLDDFEHQQRERERTEHARDGISPYGPLLGDTGKQLLEDLSTDDSDNAIEAQLRVRLVGRRRRLLQMGTPAAADAARMGLRQRGSRPPPLPVG